MCGIARGVLTGAAGNATKRIARFGLIVEVEWKSGGAKPARAELRQSLATSHGVRGRRSMEFEGDEGGCGMPIG